MFSLLSVFNQPVWDYWSMCESASIGLHIMNLLHSLSRCCGFYLWACVPRSGWMCSVSSVLCDEHVRTCTDTMRILLISTTLFSTIIQSLRSGKAPERRGLAVILQLHTGFYPLGGGGLVQTCHKEAPLLTKLHLYRPLNGNPSCFWSLLDPPEDLLTDRLCCVGVCAHHLESPSLWCHDSLGKDWDVRTPLSRTHVCLLTLCVICEAWPSAPANNILIPFPGLDVLWRARSWCCRLTRLLNYLGVKGNRQVWCADVSCRLAGVKHPELAWLQNYFTFFFWMFPSIRTVVHEMFH